MYIESGVAIIILVAVTFLLLRLRYYWRRVFAYMMFFVTPILTIFGVMSPLTGFASGATVSGNFGLSFVTPFLAYLLLTHKPDRVIAATSFFRVALNPIYMFCGPMPSTAVDNPINSAVALWRRVRAAQGDMAVGLFFVMVLSPAFAKTLALRDSLQAPDVIIFGLLFELYVYFNFAGFSMLAFAAMRVLGVRVRRNFAMPFSARSVVDYWRRWHRSLGEILARLFFIPVKAKIGVYVAAAATFLCSAAWHGVTINFFIWGLFHALCWALSRWLFLNGVKIGQFPLMVFAVIVGRVIFSESNPSILLAKMEALVSPGAWLHLFSLEYIHGLAFRTKLHLVVGASFVLYEGIFARKHDRFGVYKIHRSPLLSTSLLLYAVVCGQMDNKGAMYGNR